ncbi:MAG: amidohydrolase family protein [Acidimicrobiia bacterium]
MDRFVLISADCHAVGRPEDFRPFIEPQYLEVFDEENRKRLELAREARKASEEGGLLFSKEALEEYHSHDETEDNVMGGTSGQWDSDKRIKELEDDGVVAEVVFPNGGPFVTGRGGAPVPRELRTAGVRAYNRWLADFCAQAPGRRAGIAQLPIHDVDLAISEIEEAARAGLKGVSVPLLFDDPAAPPLYHERYEPMWAACEANGMPVHVHGGAGPDYGDGIETLTRIMLYVTEVPLWPRRMFYFLLWNGVLERHPGLQLVFTEGTCDWVPTVVPYLDYLYGSKDFAHIRSVLPVPPSEYWKRQCFVGSSSVSRAETDMRYDIGVDCMMFGSDYPHVEGTWPRTHDWVAATLGGIPVDEQRAILGGNAARLYGFDLDLLDPLAQRVGIPVADLTERRDIPALAHTQVDRPGTMMSHNFV